MYCNRWDTETYMSINFFFIKPDKEIFKNENETILLFFLENLFFIKKYSC